MNSTHLTENQLQEYLDHSLSNPAPVENHLALCPACREEISLYQQLYRQLQAPPPFNLPQDFTHIVAEAAFSAKKSAFKTNILNMLLITFLTAAAIAFAIPYFNFQSLGKEMVDSIMPQINLNSTAVTDNFSVSPDAWAKYKIWIYCAAALLFTLLLENILAGGKLARKKPLLCFI